MTAPETNVQVQEKTNDKEYNFRQLEQKYEQERQARLELEQKLNQQQTKSIPQEDEDENEPYVDHKKLKKTLNNFGQNTQTEIKKAMETARQQAKEELKQEMWVESNSDFMDVINKHAESFKQKNPALANSILKMPDGFERLKLVYENIKALGIDKPEQTKSSIQETIDAKRKGPYYQPSGVGSAPYAQVGDFSPSGQKNAYDKMQDLKNKLRI